MNVVWILVLDLCFMISSSWFITHLKKKIPRSPRASWAEAAAAHAEVPGDSSGFCEIKTVFELKSTQILL